MKLTGGAISEIYTQSPTAESATAKPNTNLPTIYIQIKIRNFNILILDLLINSLLNSHNYCVDHNTIIGILIVAIAIHITWTYGMQARPSKY